MRSQDNHNSIRRWAELPGRAEVALLSAPFTFPPIPSIALSLFKRSLEQAGMTAKVLYPMFPFVHLMKVENLRRFYNLPGSQGICEFLFAPLTDAGREADPRAFVEDCFPGRPEAEAEALCRLLAHGRSCAAEIVEATARRIVGMGARILAASSIYAQQNASLAVMRRVKALDPGITTLMGGNNVSGEMGLAVLRRYPSVDYISFGEGDENIADFCRMMLSGESGPLPYGIVGREEPCTGGIPHRLTRDMNGVCAPDYTDYFEEVRREQDGFYGPAALVSSSSAQSTDDAQYSDGFFGRTLFLEGSRGCWWGEKHACAFCGLNGRVNVYREKSPEKLLREIREACDAYPGCFIQLSDNVLGGRMFRELLPALEADGRDYQLSAEIKTNLKEADIAALVRAGFRNVQPGIESLNDHLLALMGKGNTAVHHVALLKYCRTHYLFPFWHMLFGVPGEAEEDYRALIELIPLLTHLTPPTGANPILFQRFSRYWTDPAAYGLELTPDRSYRWCYGEDEDFIRRIAMYYDLTGGPFFDAKKRHQPLYQELTDAVEGWKTLRKKGASPDLLMTQTREGVSILDTRPCRVRLLTRLTGLAAEVYRLCGDPVSPAALRAALEGRCREEALAACLDELVSDRLLLFLSGKYLALAVPSG